MLAFDYVRCYTSQATVMVMLGQSVHLTTLFILGKLAWFLCSIPINLICYMTTFRKKVFNKITDTSVQTYLSRRARHFVAHLYT